MTVSECINYIDSIEPNAYTEAQKAGWLSECEGKVYTSLFLVQPYEFTPITAADSRTLALPAPYDRMYPRYLQAMIHYANGEYDRYANSMAVFNEVWAEANRWFGGDYDVTDRLRNRRFETEIQLSQSAQVILIIPEGCALAAGRIVVQKEATYKASNWYKAPGAMPAGVYNFKVGTEWLHFTTAADYAAGTRVVYDEEYIGFVAVLPAGESDVQCEISSGRDSNGTDLQIEEPTEVSVNGEVINSFRADYRGAAPLPMLIADHGGTEISLSPWWKTAWNNDGRIVFAGHLLIPDERWSYETQYAGRRDARWRG